MAAFSVMKVMLTIFVIASEIHSEKTDKKRDLESQSSENVFYNYLPTEGPEPPSRPNFQPYFENDNTRTRHNDKSALPGYGVPPVVVDNSEHAQTHEAHRKSGTLKTGYFPPETRVMPRVSHIEAECRDDVMKLRVAFNDTFAGLIYSAGYTHDHDCMYINGTGSNTYEFYIQLNRCGTLGGSDHHKREVKNRNPTKNYMWNTITIQYNPLIEEEWDEHFKITCEYGYDFWKTVTFPFLEVDRTIKRT